MLINETIEVSRSMLSWKAVFRLFLFISSFVVRIVMDKTCRIQYLIIE